MTQRRVRASSTWSPSPVTVRKSFLTFINIDQEIFHTTQHLILTITWQSVSLQFVRLRRSSPPQSEDSFGVWPPQTTIQHRRIIDTLLLHTRHSPCTSLTFIFSPGPAPVCWPWMRTRRVWPCSLPTILTHNSQEEISLKCSWCTLPQILASFLHLSCGVLGPSFQSIDVFLMIMLECQSAVRPVNYK